MGTHCDCAAAGDSQTALREAQARTARQGECLSAFNAIGEVLLSAAYQALNASLQEIATIVGRTFGASQVCVCRLLVVNKTLQHIGLCDWRVECPERATPNNVNELPESWIRDVLNGTHGYKSLSTVGESDAAFMRRNGIQAAVLIPISIHNQIWGCMRLLYENDEPCFEAFERNALSCIAAMLASGIMRCESTELLTDSFNTNKAILDSNPFNSIMFDEQMNVIGCNLSAQKFFNLDSMADAREVFLKALTRMVLEYQPSGRKSVPFHERLRTTFEKGHCEFETCLMAEGKRAYFDIIMKKIVYKGNDAVITYMFDVTAQKETQVDLKYHGELLKALGSVASLLLTGDAGDLTQTMYRAVDLIGRATSVDRVYLWKNHTGEGGRLYASQIFEWSPEFAPQQGKAFTFDLSYDGVASSWREMLQKGQCLNKLVKDASPEEQDLLMPQDILSILLVPIFMQGSFWGFIGFDDCRDERVFSTIEEDILRICGFMAMVISETMQNEMALHLLAEREAALTSAQIKSNFLANMSHEIRTPMNAILGMTELIMHEDISDTVMGHAIDIRSASRGLLSIVNDILDISKIESGKMEIVPVQYHTSSLLVDVVGLIKMRTDKKHIAFVVKIDANMPSKLYGDEVRIRQILANLLSNAVKFTQEGQVTLTVESHMENDTCHLTFAVEDTGIGIKAADMGKIFVQFQQIDTKKNRNVEGTGLGLPIARQLAVMMGGSIDVKSEYGVGSTFTLSLDQAVASRTPITWLKHPERSTVLVYENRSAYLDSVKHALDSLGCTYRLCVNRVEMHRSLDDFKCDYIFVSSMYVNKIQALISKKQPNAVIVILNGDGNSYYKGNRISLSMPIHSLQLANIFNDDPDSYYTRGSDLYVANITAPDAKVLVVDDNAVNLKVAAGLLNIYKIKADTASSGMRAVEMVCETDYDLVFMDHMMPNMDGIDTTVAIRNLGGKYERLPIIALTANAVGGVKEMFMAEGLDDFLAKPVEMSKLNSILKRWLPNNKLRNTAIAPVHAEVSFEIPGLDIGKGLNNAGNSVDVYNEILSVYALDCECKIREMTRYHKEGNLKLLITHVHALKSASANIGASEVSGMAAGLEAAGNTGDTNYIDANLRGFFDSLSLVLDNIQNYLGSIGKKDVVRSNAVDFDFLHASLTAIEQHMENLDIDAVEHTLEVLCTYQWSDSIFEWIHTTKNCVEIFDYSGTATAVARLKKICDAERLV